MSIRWTLVASFFCGLTVACSEDGKDLGDACPDLPLYDINDPDLTTAERRALREASNSTSNGRCTTPVGTAVTDPNIRRSPSTGGSGGSAGSGGLGGAGGAGSPDGG